MHGQDSSWLANIINTSCRTRTSNWLLILVHARSWWMITATLGLYAVFLVGGSSLRNCGLACKLRKSSHNVHAMQSIRPILPSCRIQLMKMSQHYTHSQETYIRRQRKFHIEQLNSANFLCLSKHLRELVSAEIKSSHEGQKRENADSSISSSTQGKK